jgi:hypothetical protein
VIQCLSIAYQSHHCSAALLCSACISVFLLGFFFEIYVLLLCLCMHLSFLLPLSDMHLCSMRYASSVHFGCCPQHAFSPCEITLNRSNLLFFVLRIFIMPSPLPDNTPNSSSPLAITLSLFFIHGRYAKTLWLLWKLQSSTLFHLSIVSILSLHSTDRYLETLQLLWRSP